MNKQQQCLNLLGKPVDFVKRSALSEMFTSEIYERITGIVNEVCIKADGNHSFFVGDENYCFDDVLFLEGVK